MKLIIAGSRNFDQFDIAWLTNILFQMELHPKNGLTEIVNGDCRGIDALGANWAKSYGNGLTIKTFPPNWDKYGRGAGPVRNKEMANYGDELLIIWDGKSKGSASMVKSMRELGKPVHEVVLVSGKN